MVPLQCFMPCSVGEGGALLRPSAKCQAGHGLRKDVT